MTSLPTRSPDGRVRVGVIGAGSIAQIIHLPFLRDLADRFAITAVCDIASDTLDFVGDLYRVSPEARFVDYRDLCASDEVDAVLICPNGSHVPQAIAALEHGKHILVEKPLCHQKPHFHACITQGVEPLVGPEEARDDAAFIVDWARATRAL